MLYGITPQFAFRPSIFYDPNNNPLNIPCEGPKVIPVSLPMDNDDPATVYEIDFSQLIQQNQISVLQTMSIDLCDQGNYFGEIIVQQSGTQQNICFSGVILQHSPLCVLTPPKFLVSRTSPGNTNTPLQLFFMNYQAPWAG